MNQFLIILLSLFCISNSCKKHVLNKYDSFYEVIDNLIEQQIIDSTSLVVLELTKVLQDSFDEESAKRDSNSNVFLLHPPPLLSTSQISRQFLRSLSLNKLIKASDIEFIYNQISKLENFKLESYKINVKTIEKDKLISIAKWDRFHDVYKTLDRDYGVNSYIEFSNPLISEDGIILMFDLNRYCGNDCGSGIRYLVRKESNNWTIIYRKSIWVS